MHQTQSAATAALVELGPVETAVLQQFASLISGFAFVDELRVELTDEGLRVWTVIDAEPFEAAPRRQLYAAELQAVSASPAAQVSYRLVNRREYGDEKLHQILPDGDNVVWRRVPRS